MIKMEQMSQLKSRDELKQIKALYLSNGWIDTADGETENLIKQIISHTFCFTVARDGDKVIGMGRAISDSVSDAYIQDVTVLPEYRKQGIGGKIVSFLVDYLHSHGITWIGLISEPGYENFYREQGFSIMHNYTPFRYISKP